MNIMKVGTFWNSKFVTNSDIWIFILKCFHKTDFKWDYLLSWNIKKCIFRDIFITNNITKSLLWILGKLGPFKKQTQGFWSVNQNVSTNLNPHFPSVDLLHSFGPTIPVCRSIMQIYALLNLGNSISALVAGIINKQWTSRTALRWNCKYTSTVCPGSMNINFNYANVRLWLRLGQPKPTQLEPTQIRDNQSNWLRAHYNCISIRQKCQLLLASNSIMSGSPFEITKKKKQNNKRTTERNFQFPRGPVEILLQMMMNVPWLWPK